jgi:hypothetical protein
MDPITIGIIAVIGYFLYSRGGLASVGLSVPSSTGVVAPPSGVVIQGSGTLDAAQQNEFAVVQASNTALNAIPVVGPAVAAVANVLTSSLKAASAARAKQATTENAAVALAVPGWDQAIAQIVAAYNNGGLSASQTVTLIGQAWQNYWSEVGPKIQPGRNGCQSGAVTQPSGVSFCGGTTYGAACCVGYDDLKNSNNNMVYAVNQAANTGKPTPAVILAVFASKYGGINRPQYTVTFTPFVATGGL